MLACVWDGGGDGAELREDLGTCLMEQFGGNSLDVLLIAVYNIDLYIVPPFTFVHSLFLPYSPVTRSLFTSPSPATSSI